jgi:mono/diheme cytochrome c family protein
MTAAQRARCCMLLISLVGHICIAQAADTPPDGRAIYHGYATLRAGIDATSYRMPPRFAACAGCHGASAEGGREGNISIPPLLWAALFSARESLAAFASEESVMRAVTDGVARDGGVLGAAMPRYRLSDDERSAILSYLKRIGGPDDNPPGVDQNNVHLATILPLSGSSALVGLLVKQGLEEVFAKVNASGGIHGRLIHLDAIDAASEMGASLGATMLKRKPYAIVGGMWRASDASIDGLLSKNRLSKIATLVPRMRTADLDEWDADLLPPLDVQQDALVSALRSCTVAGARFGVPVVASSGSATDAEKWFDDVPEMLGATDGLSGGCLALGLGASAKLGEKRSADWERRIVLPFPIALLQSKELWLSLGRAAGRVTVELLSRSGAHLHERSLLAATTSINGFEPLSGAPVHFNRARHYAWDSDVLIDPPGIGPGSFKPGRNLTERTRSN